MKTILVILTVLSSISSSASSLDVIYGLDNRHEALDFYDTRFVDKSLSVAIRVPSRKLIENEIDKTITDIVKIPLSKAMPNICVDERFIDQNQLGDCSGFLISNNRILTAGHCAFSEFDCANTKWVFGYTKGLTQLNSSDVFSCKKIVVQKYQYSNKEILDYAIIELDRETNRTPLNFRKFGKPSIGTPLVIIGHPVGLPMKIADGAEVKLPNVDEMDHPLRSLFLRRNYFTANLDSYGGNSGSPVLNEKSGKVEGILIQGADDFKFDEEHECMISNRLSNSHKNSFEKVLRITSIPELQ